MTDVELAIRYLENMVNSQYWRLIENTDYFCEIKENILILIKELKSNSIPKDKIRDKLDEIMSYTFTSIEERNQQNYAYDRIRELLEEE